MNEVKAATHRTVHKAAAKTSPIIPAELNLTTPEAMRTAERKKEFLSPVLPEGRRNLQLLTEHA